jgi:tetratricopeptide (TPR) repeat protein
VALIRDRSIAAGTAPERAAVVASVLGDIAWPVASAELLGGGAPDPSDRERRFVAWSEALDALAGPEAAVWVFEDVHWAGGDLLAFIAHAHGQVTRGGRLIVATARPSVLEREPAWCAEDPSGERFALDLPTLLSDDARGLVTALVGSALPDALVDRIVDRSDGNCLFIEELLRTWVSVGTLVQRDDGGWRLAVPADDAPLPATVQAIYSAQLDDLPASARQAARRGSVAGREFPVRALEPLGVAAGESAVEALRRRALVTGPHDGALAGPTFAYRHALLRDAGYASLARSERADLHVRLARWLEIIAGDRALDVAETIGSHYESALQSVPSLATEVADGLDRRTCAELAAQWLERAAETALGLAAQDTARALLRRALDLTPGDSSLDRARRWDLLGEATVASADMDEAGRAFEEARSIFGSVYRDPARPHDEREVARAGLGRASARLGHVLYQQIAFGPALELATETLAEIGERDDVATVRLLILRDEAVSGLTNDYRPLQGSVELTLERAHRAGDPDVVLDALYHRVAIRHEGGTVDIEEWRELATAARARGRWPLVARALTGAAMIAMDSDRPRAAASLAEAEEVAIAQRLLEQQAWIGYLRVEDGLLFGDWTAAVRHGRRVIEIAEANAYHRVAVRTWHCLVPLAAARGDRELLAHAARWHEERRDTLPDSPYARIMRAGVDLNLADAELLPAFVPEVASRLDSFSFADSSPSWYAAIERVLDAWLAAGLADAVRAALDRFDAIDYGTDPPPSAVGEIAFLRARFRSVVDGDRAGRIVAGREALASFRALPAPWWAARAIRGLEALEDASAEELAEAAAIERSLGLDGAAD